MPPDHMSDIHLANRNVRILNWLRGLSARRCEEVRYEYAQSLGMPTCEIVWLPESLDGETLNWVYQNFTKNIDWIYSP